MDPKAFIYSLVNKENNPFKVMCKRGARAIRCASTDGPSFGGGCYINGDVGDICIATNSNANNYSYSGLGYSYQHVLYPHATEIAESVLAGSFYFQTIEIEVFSITD